MDSQYVQLKQLLVWEAKIHTSHLNQILNKEEKFYNVSYLTLTGELLEKIISSPKGKLYEHAWHYQYSKWFQDQVLLNLKPQYNNFNSKVLCLWRKDSRKEHSRKPCGKHVAFKANALVDKEPDMKS